MKIFYFAVGFAFLFVDLLWRLNFNTLPQKKNYDKSYLVKQKLKWLPARFLLGVSFFGAYYFAMLKYLWLILSIICFISCFFWLFFVLRNTQDTVSSQEEFSDPNYIKKVSTIGITTSGILLILWIYAWKTVIY
jgi:hypothetical protein